MRQNHRRGDWAVVEKDRTDHIGDEQKTDPTKVSEGEAPEIPGHHSP